MAKPDSRENKPQELKRIGDYVTIGVGDRLEGDRIERDTILGEDITLTDFVFIPSNKFEDSGEGDKKGEFVVIQFKRAGDEKLYTTSTGGKVVVDALKEMPKSYLPVSIRMTWAKSKAGRKYLTIA